MQAQILFLKSPDLLPLRDAGAAVESHHLQVRKLWDEMLAGIGVERSKACVKSKTEAA
jgi:hypothetical protein